MAWRYRSRVAKSISATREPSHRVSCTRLTLSKKSAQSAEERRRMLVMTLRTVAWLAICAWCSTWTRSSTVVASRAIRRSSHSRAGVTAGSCSRNLWPSATANAWENGSLLQHRQHRRGLGLGRAVRAEERVGDRVGALPGGASRGDALGQAPEILDEHDAQRDGQRPQLADRQRHHALIGQDEAAKRRRDRSGCPCARRTTRPARTRADSLRASRRRAWAAPGRTPAAGPRESRGSVLRRGESC